MIQEAETFALTAHAGQRYGDHPYRCHLRAVVTVLEDFDLLNEDLIAAGWLHDVVEDTETTKRDLLHGFGQDVSEIVWACTGVGDNRRERNRAIYGKIALCPRAALVKVADRIANVEQAERGSKHHALYVSEAAEFYDGVARYVPRRMWDRLWLALSPR